MRQIIKSEWQTHRWVWIWMFCCMISMYAAIGVFYVYASSVIG